METPSSVLVIGRPRLRRLAALAILKAARPGWTVLISHWIGKIFAWNLLGLVGIGLGLINSSFSDYACLRSISTRVEIDTVECARWLVAGARRNIKGQARFKHNLPVLEQAGNVWGCGQGTKGKGRAGPPPGGHDHSIRNTTFFPVSVLRTSTTGRTVMFQQLGNK